MAAIGEPRDTPADFGPAPPDTEPGWSFGAVEIKGTLLAIVADGPYGWPRLVVVLADGVRVDVWIFPHEAPTWAARLRQPVEVHARGWSGGDDHGRYRGLCLT